MKTKHLLNGLLTVLLMSASISLLAQTPKTVCQITSNPVNGESVITQGVVSSVVGDDDFYLTSGNCTIKCDGKSNNMPTQGMEIAVQGRVEVDDDDKKSTADDELELDVYYWVERGGTTPPPPEEAVTTVEEALNASPGTVALLSGSVTSWTDQNDGEGIFADLTGSMPIDFEEGNKPTLDQSIVVLGVVDKEDGVNEIDVYYWYPEGGNPPDPPGNIAWTVEEANNATNGTYAIIPGAVTNWTNESDGEGSYQDLTGSIQIDFEDGLELPSLLTPIWVVGIVETDDGSKEIEAYGWEIYSGVGVPEFAELQIQMYPNPAATHINIRADQSLTEIQIFDVSGRLVLSEQINQVSTIQVGHLTKGMYVVRLFNENQLLGYSKLVIK